MADVVYGVSAFGFKRKRLVDIKAEIEASLRADLGNFINLLPSTVFAQFIGIYAEREDALWELAEEVYNSQYLGSSEGVPFRNVLGLVGVTLLEATKTIQRDLHLYGTPGAIVPVYTLVRVAGNPSATFRTTSAAQLIAGQDQIQRMSFTAIPTSGSYKLRYLNEDSPALNYDASALNVQDALNNMTKLAGVTVTGSHLTHFDITFAGLSGKTNHPHLQVVSSTIANGSGDVTLEWTQNVQEAVPQALVDAEALEEGPTAAPLYTLTEIVNPVTGLDRVLNVQDADVGRFLEDDNSARLRSATAQAALGKGSPDAIAARLEQVAGVAKAIVFQNENDVTDANGLPPHSIRAYVQGGDEQDILDEIWFSKGGGIKSDGLISGQVLARNGLYQTVKFSRPEVVPIYVKVNVQKTADFPINGNDQIRDSLVAYINGLGIGGDVIVYPKMISALNDISGITDVELFVGTSANPTTDSNIIVPVQGIAQIIDPATDIIITVLP